MQIKSLVAIALAFTVSVSFGVVQETHAASKYYQECQQKKKHLRTERNRRERECMQACKSLPSKSKSYYDCTNGCDKKYNEESTFINKNYKCQ